MIKKFISKKILSCFLLISACSSPAVDPSIYKNIEEYDYSRLPSEKQSPLPMQQRPIRAASDYYYRQPQPYQASPQYSQPNSYQQQNPYAAQNKGYPQPGSRFYTNPYVFEPPAQYPYYDSDHYYVPPSYYNNESLDNYNSDSNQIFR